MAAAGSGSAFSPEAIAKLGLPAELVKKDKTTVPTAAALAGSEYVGLYFSAHWCGPCRGFTPALSEWFFCNGERIKLQLIFVSSDNSQAEFESYFGEMSWDYAVPYAGDARSKLDTVHKVSGIPSLIIADAAGNVITRDGRQGVMTDEGAAKFPWKPRSIREVIADAGELVDKSGAKTSPADFLKNDVIGLYFSAHWCPPCRGFTPQLASWYTAHIGPLAGKLDIAFVSSDKSQGEFNSYLAEMPWKAISFDRRDIKGELSTLLEVEGIPTLVFVDKENNVIVPDGRSKVLTDPEGFPWPPKAREALSDAMGFINDTPTLIVFTDNVTDPVAEVAAVDALDAVAAEYYKDGKVDPRIRFVLASSADEEPATAVRGFLGHTRDKAGDSNVRVTIVDVKGRKKALFDGGKLRVPTAAELSDFVKAFLAGTAPTVPVRE